MIRKGRKHQTATFKFAPFSRKQRQVLTWWLPNSPYHAYDMIIADGSIRSGKTISMIDSFLTWSLYTFKGEAFIISGRSAGALKRNVLRPMWQILQAKGIGYYYNRSENYVDIGSNTYYLFGASTEASQDVVQGLTAAGAYADEAALFPQSFIEQMIGRCSVTGTRIWMNCNPGSPYHFLKTDYIDKAAEKHIVHLHFTMDDNLSLSPDVKERYKRLYSGIWYKRMILGEWVLAEGIIYDMFTDDLLFDDAEFTKSKKSSCRRYIALDYGTTNPMVFLDIYDDGTTLWVVNEYYYDSRKEMRQKTDEQYADDFERFIDGEYPDMVIIDPSAASFKVVLRGRGYRVKDADNNVNDGIRIVAMLMTCRKLRVHQRCENTRRELSNYVWDEKAVQRGEEKPLKVNDHTCDALRYFCKTMLPKWRIQQL